MHIIYDQHKVFILRTALIENYEFIANGFWILQKIYDIAGVWYRLGRGYANFG